MAETSSTKMYEVELKFRVERFDSVLQQLDAMQAADHGLLVEEDTYFNHPTRDFAQTDEAFRIRTSNRGAFLTYKGPKLDTTTKTREEIEVPLGGDALTVAGQFATVLQSLGFRPAGTVHKRRRRFGLKREGNSIEVTLDEVRNLGTFVELEICTDAAGMEPAKACLQRLAGELGLQQSERRSYLQLLLTEGLK